METYWERRRRLAEREKVEKQQNKMKNTKGKKE